MKKGISLIVLIITIVVIIILATAIIVNIAQTNLIENASEAVVKQDFKTMQDELALYKADKYLEAKGKYDSSTLYADETTNPSIYDVIPSLKNSKYAGKVSIINGNIAISEEITEEQKNWISEIMEVETYSVSELISDMKYVVEKGKSILLPENATYEFTTTNTNISLKGRKVDTTTKATSKDSAVLKGTTENGIYTVEIYVTPKIDNNEYVIYTAEDLQRVGFLINNQIAKTHNMRLEEDIDLSTVCGESIGSWPAIGKNEEVLYKGKFDGQNHTIRNIYIDTNTSHGPYSALFGVTKNANISNVALEGGSITGWTNVGGIVAYSINTIITNCGNSATITAKKTAAGGICGIGRQIGIYNCYNKADIVCESRNDYNESYAGGIVAALRNEANAENCGVFNSYNTGDIIADGIYNGGIIGGTAYADNGVKYITNCYSTGVVYDKLTNGVYCGALLGSTNSYTKITNSYWTIDMESYFKHPNYTPTVTNSKQVTLAELKGYATTLGDAYTNDTTNINNGLPILKWEIENK